LDMELWDAIRAESRYSDFVEIMEVYGMDTLFEKDISHTLFIPDNESLASLTDTAGLMVSILENHISETVFLIRNVQGVRKLENLGGKFPLVQQTPEGFSYDLIPIEYSSPLYLNGLYYEIAEVAIPRPNLYEFTEMFSSIIKQYIDLTDSVFIDKNLSNPVGFDSLGNTVYDSVFRVVNRFERDFFPVSSEFRNRTATFILFTQEQYDVALDEMAEILGPAYTNHEDIPLPWQFNVLLPHTMKGSLFDDMLEYHQLTDTMVSVTGDTVYLDPTNIDPESKYLCSNGYTYTYHSFTVPRELYMGENRIEGEELIDSIGANAFSWKPAVTVSGYVVAPIKQRATEASEKALVNVSFPRNFNGQYNIEFHFTNIFPMKYRLEWRASYRPSGLYSVYVNDQILETKDRFGRTITEFDTYNLRQSMLSVDGVTRFLPSGNFNTVDYYVENITGFGDVKIRFEYKGPGIASENGFNIDFVALVPANKK
jgi:hypothetical protein